MPFFATKWRWNLKTISIVSHDKFATKFASRINKEKEKKDIPIVFQKEKGFFKKTSIFLHTCLTHVSVSTYIPSKSGISYSFNPLEAERESRSKIKFVAGNWRKKKKNGLPNETISYFPLHAPLYNTRLSLNELREIPISIWLPCASSLSRSPSYYVVMMDH